MPRQTFSGSGYTLAEIEFEETQIWGTGGSVYPRLCIQTRLWLRAGSTDQPCEWRFSNPITSISVNPIGKVSDSLPVPFSEVRQSRWPQAFEHHVLLEFPLDGNRIAALERVRAGKDLEFQLNASLLVTESNVAPQPKAPDAPWIILGVRNSQHLHASFKVTIPKTVWLDKVLPQVGYGQVYVIELPAAPIEACAALEHSFKALQQAQERHKQGFYDDAVGKCRLAIEKLLVKAKVKQPDGTTKEVPILPPSWETKVGKPTYDWLSSILVPLKNATNVPHHSPNPHFDQLESLLIQQVTAALIAYAARCGPL